MGKILCPHCNQEIDLNTVEIVEEKREKTTEEILKELGAHKVVIKLHKEVSAEVEVVVVAE